MIENLKKMLSEIEEAITYAIETDTAYTREFSKLVKQKRILKRTIRKMEGIYLSGMRQKIPSDTKRGEKK